MIQTYFEILKEVIKGLMVLFVCSFPLIKLYIMRWPCIHTQISWFDLILLKIYSQIVNLSTQALSAEKFPTFCLKLSFHVWIQFIECSLFKWVQTSQVLVGAYWGYPLKWEKIFWICKRLYTKNYSHVWCGLLMHLDKAYITIWRDLPLYSRQTNILW